VADASAAVKGRVVNALYALRFGRFLGGTARQPQEGGGLPAPIVAEQRREAEEHQAKRHTEEAGKRKARNEA
jgi:hypothetical protein